MASCYESIDVRHEHCVDDVTRNRPEIRHAMNDAVIEELTRWADGAAPAPQLRMAVLRGAGKTCCGMPAFLHKRPPGWVEDECS